MKKQILLTFASLLLCFPVLAQNVEIKGIVKSAADSEPLIGVSIILKNTMSGTITDIDGAFTLKANKDDLLEISYIGYDTKLIKVGSKKEYVILLEESALLLDEVIAVGYRTERKADLTGAVSVVDVDEMMIAAENNPMKALQGKIPGMQVSADGNPSGAASIRIRGIGTMNSNDPLFIIDGVPSQSGMHELNSNDIESVQVLRDASAASIYGSRAANGVIIITTKKGKEGVVKIDFDAYLSLSGFQSRIKMLNSEEYASTLWKSSVNGGVDPNTLGFDFLHFDQGVDGSGNPVLNNVYFSEYLDGKKTMKPANTDWFDEITRTGVAQSYNLAASNGTERGNYYFSLGYYDNEGLVKNTNFERISTRINTDFKLFDGKVVIGENVTINRTSEVGQPYNITEAAMMAVPFIPVRTADNTSWGGPVKPLPDRQNPVRLVEHNKYNRYKYWRVLGNAFLNINPIEGLNLRSNFGVDYGNFNKRSLHFSYNSGFLEEGFDKTASSLEQSHWMKWNWSNTATYDFEIGDHRFETLLGMEMFNQGDTHFSVTGKGFSDESPGYMWPDLATASVTGSGGPGEMFSLMSFFGKVNYVYDNKYMASVTVRRDGSSRFHKDNRWGTFPAFNFGWRITQEDFMKSSLNVLSDLKLRFGWGQNGNQATDHLAIYNIYTPYYGTGGDYVWGDVWNTSYDIMGNGTGQLPSGFKRNRIGNPDLKWETTTQSNIGLDFAFFDHSLYGSAEYYIKKTKDILYEPPYAGIKGEGAYQIFNGASMENKGFEFSLGYRNRTASGLAYDITGNISTNKNKVTKLPESVLIGYGGNGKWDNILGRPLGSMYGYVADGLFKSQEDLDQHARQDGKDIGRIRYRDLNNDGVVNEDDRTWIGDPFPDFNYGLNVNLEYKDFDFSFFLQGVHNVDVVNDVKRHTDFWGIVDIYSNKGRRLLNAYDPITNPDSGIPSITGLDTNDESRFSTYFVENGSYLKLRTVQLGYSLPKNCLEKIRLSRLRFYVSGQNLFTIKSKSFTGKDPENPGFGYPIPIMVTFGLSASF